MDKDNLEAAIAGLVAKIPQGVAATDPGAYEAMAKGKMIVSTDPEELLALEKSGIPEFGVDFLQRTPEGGLPSISVAGTRFFFGYHPALYEKYSGQPVLWDIEKLVPGLFDSN